MSGRENQSVLASFLEFFYIAPAGRSLHLRPFETEALNYFVKFEPVFSDATIIFIFASMYINDL